VTGIVVVSHSRALATAAVQLATEMVQGQDVRIAVAAGLDETTLGTDATAIADAVAEVDDGTGVVVLMDLGSAVLSAELACELIDPELAQRVTLSPAPLVEGLVVAAVAAAGGAEPAEVAAEAGAALLAKQSQLGGPGDGGRRPDEPGGTAVTGEFEVRNAHGLHARPAAALVRLVRSADADVQVRNATTDSGWVPAASLSRLATLGAGQGHRVGIRATGPDAGRVLADLLALAARNFDEPDARAAPSPPAGSPRTPLSGEPVASEASSRGAGGALEAPDPDPAASHAGPRAGPVGPFPAAPGVAVGPAFSPARAPIDLSSDTGGDPAAAWERSLAAVATARAALERTRTATIGAVGADEAAIFGAQLLLLDDPELLTDVRRRVDDGTGPARSWLDATEAIARTLDAAPDPYLRARAADVRGTGSAVARALVGAPEAALAGPAGGGILVADDLTPAQVAALPADTVRGIVLAAGSPTGHSAILARARGIPTVVSAGVPARSIAAGTRLALDGSTGELIVDPTPEQVAEFEGRRRAAATAAAAALATAAAPAVTGDGVAVLVGANLGRVSDAELAAGSGADLAGLVRTEFLFLHRSAAPDVDEQVAAYRGLAAALGGRRITLRTLDVGGDKPLPYAPQPAEANPFLGVRGLRFALAEQRLLREQLLAVARVAHETPVSVMFPMVTSLDELLEARRRLRQALDTVGRGDPPGLQVGMMVEVPAAALRAASFAPHVDFFSIGTNDLAQYALAVERGNPQLVALGDPLDPGVLALVAAVGRVGAGPGGPTVSVCGELAADEQAVPLLVAMGVRELSVAPPAVPAVKAAVRRIAGAANADLVRRALAAPDPATVRALLQ
jgi:phosphoenolpyruvate-protein phosphotransferase/dihydroxyacetone kinase phosphotransfer subunit